MTHISCHEHWEQSLMTCTQRATLCKKCPYTDFFLVRIFPYYSNWIQENTDQKKLHIWTLFTQSFTPRSHLGKFFQCVEQSPTGYEVGCCIRALFRYPFRPKHSPSPAISTMKMQIYCKTRTSFSINSWPLE